MEHLSSCRIYRRRQQQQVNGLLLLLLLVPLLQPASVIGSSDQRCYNGPAPVIVNEDADVYLGVLLNVHEMGDEIEGKCSTTLHREAVELYESLRWYLSFINQNSGQVASRLIKDSLIPGMKLGLKIFDACGDADLAERQLGALFPELLEDDDVAGGADCPQRQGLDQVSHGAMIGLLDFAGLTDEDPEIGEQLVSFSIPYMAVRLDDFLPADQVAEALVQFAKRMMWERVSVLYAGDDDYSMAITKAVSSNAHESGICFESYAEVGSDSELQGISQGTDDAAVSSINNASVTAVLVIAPPEDAHNVTTWMQEQRQQQQNKRNHRYQWLFAQPWAAESTDLLAQLSSQSDVYALAVSPIIVDPFETYWNRRKTPSLAYTQENRWFLDYFAGMKRCRLPDLADEIDQDSTLPLCHNFNNLPESALDRVLRHSRVLPAVHVLNTFATAFRRARDAKCIRRNQRPPAQSTTELGYCSALREMTRKEFVDEFFSKIEVHHGGPGSRVPSGFVGYKKTSSHKMEDVRFSLVRSTVDQVKELFSYHKASGVQSVDPTMTMKPDAQLSVRCPSRDGCSHCAFFQQPGAFYKTTPVRSSQPLPIDQEPSSTSTHRLEKVLTAVAAAGQAFNASQTGSSQDDDQSSLVSAKGKITDIVIPALFAVHKAGPNPSQCSAQVDPDAIQEVEAFLWALDLVNSNVELLKDVEIGAVIYDTCSSPAQAINIVSSVLGDTNGTTTKEESDEEVDIKPDELLAVVSAATGDETEAAASILATSERSIATISAKERSDSRLTNPGHQLQVAVPMSLAARAVVDLIKYAGWTYISVIYSGHDADAVSGLRHFQQLIENTQICTGVVERLNRTRGSPLALDPLFEHLTASRMMDTGGRVVVLWTDEADTQAILAKLHLLSPAAADRYKQLVWISAAGWIGGGRVYNMVKDVGKWIVVRPLVPIVEEFAQHYARLRPENNERNPWYAEYWEQLNRECQEQPNHPDCPAAAVQQRIRPSTTNLIQTVFVIASALARMIEDDDCSSANKNNEQTALLCSGNNVNATVANYREALIGYLQNTGTDRAGAEGEFGFTDQGYGDTQLEIAEVRGGFSDFTYLQMGIYDHEDGLQMGNGEGLISVQSIVSECHNSNNGRKEVCSAGCMTRQQNQMLMTASRDRLYVMGLFDVREPATTATGGSCSNNVTSHGLQQTEAFLWALEQVNQMPHLLPGVQLGAVALDGCGSNQKRTAEIDRFFTSTVVRSGIEENRVVALVLTTPQEMDQSVLSDLKENYQQLPVVVSSAVGPREVAKTVTSSPLLQLSPSISMTTRLIGDLLHNMNWTHVSSVCSSHPQFPTYGAICEEFQNSIAQYGVSYAVDLAVDESASTTGTDYWHEVASLVVAKAQEPNGARVLIALLPDVQLLQLLTALSRLPIASQRSIVLITLSNCNSRNSSNTDAKIQAATEALMAVLLLRCQSPTSGTFFEDLELPNKFQLSSPNPWLSKYWTQTFQCRGITCKNKALDESGYRRDETVSNTINGVLAVAQALERVRQMLCPNVESGVCSAMVAQRDLRPLVERALVDRSFMDIGGRLVDFDPDSGVSKDATIEVVCMHSDGQQQAEPIVAGTFSLRRGLTLDRLKLKAVNVEGRSISLQSIASRCVNCNEQQTTKIPSTQTQQPEQQQWHPSQYMQIKPKTSPGFSLVGMLPFHRQGLKPLTCGPMHSGRMFQNLAAVAFLFERLQQQQQLHFSGNSNGTVQQIGAVFLDSCGRVERAQQRLLSFISDNNAPIWSPNIIGAVTLDGETAHAVANVLGEASIPQITVAIDGHRSTSHQQYYGVGDDKTKWHSLGAGGQTFQSVPTAEDEVKALFDIVHDLAWKHVVLFYDDSQSGVSDRDLFIQHVRRHRAGEDGQLHGICLGAQIRVNKFGQSDVLDLHAQLQAIASDLPTLSVAVLLLDNPAQVQHVLLVLEDVGLSKRFIVLANHAWGANHRDIMFQSASHQLAGVLTVSMESYPVPGFGQFLAGLTLKNHSTIPDDWFQEYFQHHFQCHLVGSKVIQRMYPKQCMGTETITLMDDSEQDPYVYHTLAALETYFKALHHFLQLYCPTLSGEKQPSQLSDCGPSALERFNAVLNDMVNQREPSPVLSPPMVSLIPPRRAYRGVVVWNAQYHADKPASYERVGFWRPHQQQQENSVGNRLELDRSRMKFYVPYSAVPSVECLTGACLSICSAQYSPTVTHSTNRNREPPTPGTNIKLAGPELPTNFSTAWGVVAIVFCILGLVGCMACASYFIRNLSKPSTPTSVLAYLILSGIALLYITTIFFLIQPSEISCGLRRFFLGLSYSIIYSGLLVRAVHSWRRISRGGVQTLADRQNSQQQQPQQQTSIGSGSTGSLDMADVTKPPGLVFSTMALIAVQVILLSAWLIFKPPTAVPAPQQQLLTGLLWRCSPSDSFESELVISLILPIVLIFTALLFSLVVWRSSDAPRDSRSIAACCCLLAFVTVIWTLVATQASFKFREPAIVIGNIICAKIILIILYGRKVYEISVMRQESRNLAILSQFTISKSLQPSLHNFATNRSPSGIYTTDLDIDLPTGITGESYVAGAEDPAMGLCLGLAGGVSRDGSRRSSRILVDEAGNPLQPTASYLHRQRGEMLNDQIVPYPVYPPRSTNSDRTSACSRSVEGDRDLSDSDDIQNSKYRTYSSHPTSRRSSVDLSPDGTPSSAAGTQQQRPPLMVRRVGSRQMLVLGDEASIHGRVSKI